MRQYDASLFYMLLLQPSIRILYFVQTVYFYMANTCCRDRKPTLSSPQAQHPL